MKPLNELGFHFGVPEEGISYEIFLKVLEDGDKNYMRMGQENKLCLVFPNPRWFVSPREYVWFTRCYIRLGGEEVIVSFIFGDQLVCRSERSGWFEYSAMRGTITPLWTSDSERPIVIAEKGRVSSKAYDDVHEVSGQVLKLREVGLLQTWLKLGTDTSMFTKGLRAHFNLTDVSVNCDWARGTAYAQVGDTPITLSQFLAIVERPDLLGRDSNSDLSWIERLTKF